MRIDVILPCLNEAAALPWVLLGLVGLHVVTAFVHLLVFRDGVMSRMLPGKAAT